VSEWVLVSVARFGAVRTWLCHDLWPGAFGAMSCNLRDGDDKRVVAGRLDL
jgi:hypothetical protein